MLTGSKASANRKPIGQAHDASRQPRWGARQAETHRGWPATGNGIAAAMV